MTGDRLLEMAALCLVGVLAGFFAYSLLDDLVHRRPL